MMRNKREVMGIEDSEATLREEVMRREVRNVTEMEVMMIDE